MKCLETLVRVGGLFNWDYPNAPMDLCFYKDNYCCLLNTAHEGYSKMYIEEKEAAFLESMGINLCEITPWYVDLLVLFFLIQSSMPQENLLYLGISSMHMDNTVLKLEGKPVLLLSANFHQSNDIQISLV